MRVAIIIVLLLLLPSAYAAEFTWGCCLPSGGECIAGNSAVYATASAFSQVCAAAGGALKTASQCQANGWCTVGCCCASSNVPGYSTINQNEELLNSTQWQCTSKSTPSLTYNFMTVQDSCVATCGGTPVTPASLTLSGTVKRIGDGPMPNEQVILAQGATRADATTDASGKYSFTNLQSKKYTLIVAPNNCHAQTADVLLDASKTKNFDIDCSTTGCTNAKPVITNLSWVKGTDEATFDITYDDSCATFEQFEVLRCEGNSCTGVLATTAKHVTDSGLREQTAYCYKVQARSSTGVVTSDQACLTKADVACMTTTADKWCDESAILACTDKNTLLTTSCGNLACVDTNTGPACGELPACNKCNGLLGYFGKLGLQVPIGSGVQRYLTCGVDAPGCYEDAALNAKPTLMETFGSCSSVKNCADYRSEATCNADACRQGGCGWSQVNPELGKGVCVPKTGTPPCSRCNELLGYCNKDACLTISKQCYYDDVTANGISNGITAQGCLASQEMACRFYDTQSDCTGGVDAKYNIHYTGDKRDGGDNSHTVSKDKFSFGTCTWSVDHCMKDADNFRIADEDDCIEDGLSGEVLTSCLRDITPPVTSLLLKPPVNGASVYGSSQVTSIPVSVSDDAAPLAQIRTYTCLHRITQAPCYPDKPISQLALPDEDAEYNLRYYSMDNHHNSEVIKYANISVKKDNVPRLNTVDINER